VYPIRYEADYVEKRNRLSTFFRWLLIIPHTIVAYLYGIAFLVTVVIAWFALLFTARYPQGLYEFNAGVLRFFTRFNGYRWLVTDQFPSFGTAPDDNYPVRVQVDPPQERYDRLKVAFRVILGIPVLLLAYVMNLLLELGAIAAWFVIVFTGKQLPGIHRTLALGMAYTTRAFAYFALLTDKYPPFTEAGELDAAAPVAPLPPGREAEMVPGPAAPIAAPERPESVGGFDPPRAPGT
jgi:Domain of unknown function (DUF4389)